jgi:type I restriction-modification system DNA methylase subunit
MHLDYFENIDNFYPALKTIFEDLNIPVNYIAEEPARPRDILTNTFKEANPAFKLMEDVYFLGMVDDAAFEGNKSISADKIKTDYDGLLLFGVTLKERGNGLLPTRSHLAEITRAFNREFHYTPVVVVFRDVKPNNPHTGHLKILQELAIARTGRNAVNSFDGLYKYWQSVFNVSVLNREFYKELSNWYFWALKKVTFPGASIKADQNGLFKEDERVKEHNAKNLIRLLTRLLFVWFVKEKDLIPEELFDMSYIKEELLQEFQPQRLGNLFEEEAKGSTYYKSVLQNLFFATLNQTMGKREFRKDKQHMNVTNLMRYKSCFKNPEKFIKLVEDIVPFMNGGLFECLDQPHETIKGRQGGDKIIYIDGFSDRKDNELFVPDYIFFGDKEHVDLSEDYGNKSKTYKSAPVKGLINILNSYKFTITENTPIEEDVALDPELLGRVFENLLASYNPETKTTARKQTGSFYTPREIVNYMVDESLIAYFKNKLSDIEDADELDTKLRQLISFDNIQPFQENKIKKKIIKAIDACSILDPACGSGAFPMGILQKMVHLLHKLDPGNERWKQRQIDKVNEAIEKAEEIEDSSRSQSVVKELKEQIRDIEDSFENNELDYGRKLYLLENCIYGVDIQEIATQISKLRFFISLIVDQSVDKNKENFGIRPLPNLETKFVAANTLIGIEKPEKQGKLFDNPEIKKLEDGLKKVRHKIFNSKSPGRKRELRDEDKTLRNQISELLIEGGWGNKTARQLASWDPYDQNASSPFFDPEWMFGIVDGFDVVIGNPPYVFTRDVEFDGNFKKYIEDEYFAKMIRGRKSKSNQSGKINLFALFIVKGLFVSSKNGYLSYIIPNNILRTTTYDIVRRYVLENAHVEQVVDLGSGIFDNVTASTIILGLSNQDTTSKTKVITEIKNLEKYDFETKIFDQSQFFKNVSHSFNIYMDGLSMNISNIISQRKKLLGTYCVDNIEGIVAHKHLIFDSMGHNRVPLIEGKDVKRFYINEPSNFLTWNQKKIHRTRPGYLWSAEKKIIIQRISGGKKPLVCSVDDKRYKSFALTNNLLLKEVYKTCYYFIAGLLNSDVLNWYYANNFSNNSTLTVNISKTFMDQLPIAEYSSSVSLISELLHFISGNIYSSDFQSILNSVIFNLYFPDHMKEKEIDILKFVEQDLKEVLGEDDFEQLPDEQKENIIEELHKRWSNPDSEIVKRMNSFAEKSPDILKPILESK